MIFGKRFKCSSVAESHDIPVNPGRGFYKLFYAELGACDLRQFDGVDLSRVSLVLLVIDIACCKDRALDDGDIEAIRSVMDYFISKDKRLILRFSYDHDGRGMMRAPDRIGLVLAHARALADLIREYKSHIFVYQGLLVGDWGEMHSTRYADSSFLEKIYDVMSGSGVDIAVRKPSQQELLPVRGNVRPILFNDAMLADETELGTIRSDRSQRDEQIIFNVSNTSPYGGEMVYGTGFAGRQKPEVLTDMLKKRHITYLNRDYDMAMYDHLKKVSVSCDGYRTDAFTYLSENLGYRYVIKKVAYKNKKLMIYVENKGFSKPYVPIEMHLVSETGESVSLASYIVSDITPEETKCYVFPLKDGCFGDIFVCADTVDLRERVFFSNVSDGKGYVFAGSLKK